ncbi:MAG: methyltransferase domain-containing protein [Acidobacteria bacterium]|nr:methyltransferase domain-containing protein [Acidobacteriota bacterium]
MSAPEMMSMAADLTPWMARLEARHLADLQFVEVSRALCALSSAYVERRQTALSAHRVLDGAGKRAAFALYYGPLHFLATTQVLRGLAPAIDAVGPDAVVDLGCGTGAAGAAAAVTIGARTILGLDTHPWALAEARHTYAAFGLSGTVTRGSAARLRGPRRPSLIVASYLVNELPDAERALLLPRLLDAVRSGHRVLILEPLATSAVPWWSEWVHAFAALGARADEWKLEVEPPALVRRLGDAAGLTPTAIKVRTLHAGLVAPLPGHVLPGRVA